MRATRGFVFALLLLVPVACGGGGGGTAQVTLTAENAEQVAGDVLGGLQFLSDFESLLGDFVSVIEDLDSGTYPCPGGGTMTLSIVDAPPLGVISTGDSASFAFSDCSVDTGGETVTMDGSLAFQVTDAIDVPPPGFDAVVRFTFSNLTMASGTETITVSGGFSIHAISPDDVVVTTVVTGDSLRASISGPGLSESASIEDFDDERTEDEGTGAFTVTTRGTIYESEIGGEVDYETTAPLEGTDPNPPGAGTLLVTGGGGTSMLVVAVDEVNVRLDVDTDGDGIRETVIDTTWAALND